VVREEEGREGLEDATYGFSPPLARARRDEVFFGILMPVCRGNVPEHHIVFF
jgi:hypothetical protein